MLAHHHQDYCIILLVGDPFKPSFATVTGWGGSSKSYPSFSISFMLHEANRAIPTLCMVPQPHCLVSSNKNMAFYHRGIGIRTTGRIPMKTLGNLSIIIGALWTAHTDYSMLRKVDLKKHKVQRYWDYSQNIRWGVFPSDQVPMMSSWFFLLRLVGFESHENLVPNSMISISHQRGGISIDNLVPKFVADQQSWVSRWICGKNLPIASNGWTILLAGFQYQTTIWGS